MVLCFCYESPSFLNIISCEVKKRNEYMILGDVGVGGIFFFFFFLGGGGRMESNLVPKKDKRHCFDLMNHLFASVI